MSVLCLFHTVKPRSALAALTMGVSLVTLASLSAGTVMAQQAADTPLVAPDNLEIGLQSAPPSVASISAEDVEQLQRDLQATSDRDLNDALGISDNFDAEPTQPRTSGGSRGTASPGQSILRPIDDNPGAGAVSRASGGLTTFSDDIPDAPASPFSAHSIGGPATGRGSVFIEPNPFADRQLSPPVFEDPTMLPVAPFPTEVQRTVRLRGGSLHGVDAKDLRLHTRQRPVARGLNCSPPDLRLEEIGDPQRPHTYRLTGVIETPTTGYGYVSQSTDQRNNFIRPTGGPTLMAMTLSMKAPEIGHHDPDGHVHIREMVRLSPNAKRLDVLVNNIIFRRAQLYYCRVPGTLD